jgi:hypothetical protein
MAGAVGPHEEKHNGVAPRNERVVMRPRVNPALVCLQSVYKRTFSTF